MNKNGFILKVLYNIINGSYLKITKASILKVNAICYQDCRNLVYFEMLPLKAKVSSVYAHD